jgi:two-component system chemotaxis response regulator CheB
MANRNIIVIGASSGGFMALRELVKTLPRNLDAAVFIVWHIPPDIQGVLPQSLNKIGNLPAANATDHEPIVNGRIYVAPPDHHLLLEENEIRITRGPKENRFRPAVDPLFRSAAYIFGPRVIGVVLSGALDDGTAGLWIIKQRGGIAIVQDPDEAEVRSMPENALKAVDIDYTLPVDEMGPLLGTLVQEEPAETVSGPQERTRMEIDVAKENHPSYEDVTQFGEWSAYSCPECHGVLRALMEGSRIRYRCHTGHAYSADTLLAAITERTEENLWSAIRSMQEGIMLMNHIGDHYAERNKPKVAASYFKKAREAGERLEMVRKAVEEHEQLSLDAISGRFGSGKKDIAK